MGSCANRAKRRCGGSLSTLLAWLLLAATTLAADATPVADAEQDAASQAQLGLQRLRTEAYAPAEFSVELFDRLWEFWPADLKEKAASATPEERRRMAFERYGLIADPQNPAGAPLGVVDDGTGGWSMNCLGCHQGKVAGQAIWGVPNSHFAFQTLTTERLC